MAEQEGSFEKAVKEFMVLSGGLACEVWDYLERKISLFTTNE